MSRHVPTAFVTVTVEVDVRTVERIFGAAAVTDPAASLAGFLERLTADALAEALYDRRIVNPTSRVRVTFTTDDGRTVRFEDGKGGEELDR